MRVVDTSAWIEWLAGSATGQRVAGEFPARERHIVPTIVQFELAVWAMREVSRPTLRRIMADLAQGRVVALSSAIAFRAAQIRSADKLATADAIIYATARAYEADILTCDAHFKDLPGVIYVAKAAP